MARYIDVIEWRPTDPSALVGRVPEDGPGDIRFGAQLIVRESQSAVFFRDGQSMDVFGPGRHTLSTANLPVVSEWLQKFTGGKNVFSAEVYFVNQAVQTDLKWGTPNPIDLQDPDLGWVQLRAFGTMSVRIEDPQLFINTLVGTQGGYSASALNKLLKNSVQNRLGDLIATNFKSYATIRRNQDELAAAMKVKVKDDFGKYGVGLRDFFISDVSVPEEIQEAFRKRATMGALGVRSYAEMQAADAMRDMANNQGTGGSTMGAGLGMGMGMMMPQMMSGMMQGGMMQPGMQQGGMMQPGMMQGGMMQGGMQQPGMMQQAQQAPAQQQAMISCGQCHAQVPEGTKFCPQCGGKIVPPAPAGAIPCPGCGKPVPEGTKFCPECGTKIEVPQPKVCPECKTELSPTAKFCNNCGTKV
ncbi:SPFH domain-containing protein [bacterium]|nr:SPFH domain-containing protein [bacterium]